MYESRLCHELPLLVEHTYLRGLERESEGLALTWLEDGPRIGAIKSLHHVALLGWDVVVALDFLPLVRNCGRSVILNHYTVVLNFTDLGVHK